VILVAGGTGRLGTLVPSHLVDRGFDVRILTRDAARARHLESARVQVAEDVRDGLAVDKAVAGVRTIVSAIHGFTDPRGPRAIDRSGDRQLIGAARAAGVLAAGLFAHDLAGSRRDGSVELDACGTAKGFHSCQRLVSGVSKEESSPGIGEPVCVVIRVPSALMDEEHVELGGVGGPDHVGRFLARDALAQRARSV